MWADSTGNDHQVLTESAKEEIRGQLGRLLASSYFSHSKRFPNFLRFVVEQTLSGDADNIKERTLGIEIFGRDADYDTATDPIVRVTAAEIRKRVAQYYQDPAHEDELRITLPSGSYIPQFQQPKANGEAAAVEIEVPAVQTKTESPTVADLPAHRRWLQILLTGVIAAVITAGAIFLWQRAHNSPFEFFWGPVIDSSDPVLLCVADQSEYSGISLRDAAEPSHLTVINDHFTAVVIDDLDATVEVAGILQSKGKRYSLKGEGATNLEDLRSGPTVLIGAFDNAWTLRLTNPLRFHFANDAGMNHLRIVDSSNPGQSSWVVDRSVQMATNNYRDYGLVARFTDSTTGRLTVVIAGIARGGTIVAGQFLTDPANLAELEHAAQTAGNKKNMEVVLSTQIIDGEPGSPKIEATYFW